MVKKILSIVLWVVTAAALVVLFIFARESYLDKPLQEVRIMAESDSGFVRRSVLHDEIAKECAKAKVGTVNMVRLQRHLDNNPWVESNASYIDLKGNLNVRYKEYVPMLRVFSNDGRSVYVTESGYVLPPSDTYTPYVLIASGNFTVKDTLGYTLSDTLDRDRNLLNALHWCKAIGKNRFASNSVGQLYCNGKNGFELSVKGLDMQVVVGDTTLAADKLARLEVFMKRKVNSPETKNMKSINLNYKNQIVCTKR